MLFKDTYHWIGYKYGTSRKFMERAAEEHFGKKLKSDDEVSPESVIDLIENTSLSKRPEAKEALHYLRNEQRWPWVDSLETKVEREERAERIKKDYHTHMLEEILDRLARLDGATPTTAPRKFSELRLDEEAIGKELGR